MPFAALNTPLRNYKGSLFEGGIRVPWAMRWKGNIKPGTVVDEPIIGLDLLPTVIEAAGGRIDPEWNLDGRSFLGSLTGSGSKVAADRPLFWRQFGADGELAMRKGDWKLYWERLTETPPMLFNLSEDIGETTDLAARHPDQVRTMTAELDAWSQEMAQPHWGPGSDAWVERGRKPFSALQRERTRDEKVRQRAERQRAE